MYGTLIRFRPIPGKEQAIIGGSREWAQRRGINVGLVSQFILTPDKGNGEIAGLCVFESKGAYTSNADDPEQHLEYRQMRALLLEDPIWTDGTIVEIQPVSVPL